MSSKTIKNRQTPQPKHSTDQTEFRPYARDPSPRRNAGGRSHRWFDILKPLVKRPGVWFVIAETTDESAIPSLRTRITPLKKRLLTIPRPDDEWDFTFRSEKEYDEDGMSTITYGRLYGMYIGPAQEE